MRLCMLMMVRRILMMVLMIFSLGEWTELDFWTEEKVEKCRENMREERFGTKEGIVKYQ